MATVKVHTGGPLPIWSNAGTSQTHAGTAPMPSTDAAQIRVTQEMNNKTSGVTSVTVAARYSEDLVTWGTWSAVSGATAQTANGVQHDDTWLNPRTGVTPKRYVQLGWLIVATNATYNEMCNMGWRIECMSD